jgi:RNA polymerase-binding transcription factor DksA
MLSADFLKKIEERLLKQKNDTLGHLEELKSHDPFNLDYTPADGQDRNSPDDEAQVNEMHDRITSQITSMDKQLVRIESSIARIHDGSYGKCDVCGTEISESRLLVMPLTSMCLEHEKSLEKQVKSNAP